MITTKVLLCYKFTERYFVQERVLFPKSKVAYFYFSAFFFTFQYTGSFRVQRRSQSVESFPYYESALRYRRRTTFFSAKHLLYRKQKKGYKTLYPPETFSIQEDKLQSVLQYQHKLDPFLFREILLLCFILFYYILFYFVIFYYI